MVIIFQVEKARNQLLNKRIVYTLRQMRKIEGRDWATDRRGNKKICDVNIKLINYSILRKLNLENYVFNSGFDSVDNWIDALRPSQNRWKSFYLYEVRRID